MGSKSIDRVLYRTAFSFIGIIGRRRVMEKRGSYENQTVIVTKTYRLMPGSDKYSKSSKTSEKH